MLSSGSQDITSVSPFVELPVKCRVAFGNRVWRKSGLEKPCRSIELLEACWAGGRMLIHVNCGIPEAGENTFKVGGVQGSLALSIGWWGKENLIQENSMKENSEYWAVVQVDFQNNFDLSLGDPGRLDFFP